MTTTHFASTVPGAPVHLVVAFTVAKNPAFHPRYDHLMQILLGLIVVGLGLIANLIWRGQRRRGAKPTDRHREP
jgi:hypothetical protein